MKKNKREDIHAWCDELGVEVVMGAETHITLKTNTKLNCSCGNTSGEKPNSHICPICSGQPGAMPETNGEAVRQAIVFGKAIDANIADVLMFDRKHYEYPDLPA
jgi:aspartyl-tRNA synthetase